MPKRTPQLDIAPNTVTRRLNADEAKQIAIEWVSVLVQREMDFCLIGVNRKWVTVTNLF